MPKFKITHDINPKRTEQCECQNFQDLNNWIKKIFNIEVANIKFKKPRIKDQATFKRQIKEGIQIFILGQARKQQHKKTKQQLQKQVKQLEIIQTMRQQLKLSPHQKLIKKLNQLGIKQRGIQYYNKETQKIQDLGIQYATCPLHLLKYVNEFKRYCYQYKITKKNPDSLIIKELSNIFHQMEKGQNVVNPLQFISSWIPYCADEIQYPYPTYDLNYFLIKTFQIMKMAFDLDQQRMQQQSNSRIDLATKIFGVQVLTKRQDITNLDEDDKESIKSINKKVIKYALECDLSKPQFNTLNAGIRKRFEGQNLWRNFYAFDIQYTQTIQTIQRLPKYIFLHASRFGYAPMRPQSEPLQFYENKKSYHQVRYNQIIDLFDLCNEKLKNSLKQAFNGRFLRDQMFKNYKKDERYNQMKDNLPNKELYSENELNYMFFDIILQKQQKFHGYYFQEPKKECKPTGEYQLVGVVMHKGDYYHHPNECHKHNCIGQFQTFVYSMNRKWIKYHKAEVQYIDVDEVMNQKYWGKEGEYTPVLFLYREVRMVYMIIQQDRIRKPRKSQSKKKDVQK